MNNIINFINRSNLEEIKNNLLNILFNNKYCNKILGSGISGIVFEQKTNKYIKIKSSLNNKIKIYIVKKYNKNINNNIIFDIQKDQLYMYGISLLFDILILIYIRILWNEKKSIHLPLMLGYSICSDNYDDIEIILEKNGLKKDIKIKLNKDVIYYNNKYKNRIITLQDLLEYIYIFYDDKTKKIKVPNNIECDITLLIDYITISIIHTYNVLFKNNIYVRDMHFNNIFIYWLNKNSYLDDINLKDIKYVYYKNKNNIIKIETFGLIIKIGDVGHFFMKPRKDIIIYSNLSDISYINLYNHNFINGNGIISFINFLQDNLPYNLIKNTIIIDIYKNIYPYNEFSFSFYYKNELFNNLITYEDLLDKFNKYNVNQYIYNINSILL